MTERIETGEYIDSTHFNDSILPYPESLGLLHMFCGYGPNSQGRSQGDTIKTILYLQQDFFFVPPCFSDRDFANAWMEFVLVLTGSCHKRQKPEAPTPQAPIRVRQTRKVANAKRLNRNTNLA